VFAGIVILTGKAKSSYQLLVVLIILAHWAVVLRPVGNGLATTEILELFPYLETEVGEPVSKLFKIVFCPKTELLIQQIKKTFKRVKILVIIIEIKLIKLEINNTLLNEEKIINYTPLT